MTAAEDILRAETLERAAHELLNEYSHDPYLRWGVTFVVKWLRNKARVYRIHATERE